MKNELHVYISVPSTEVSYSEAVASQFEKARRIANLFELEPISWIEAVQPHLSAGLDSRPIFIELLESVERGHVDAVFIQNKDIFLNDPDLWDYFINVLKKNGVALYSEDGRFDIGRDDELNLSELAREVARYDRYEMTEVQSQLQNHCIKNGYFFDSYVPYGYKVKDHHLIVDWEASEWVTEMFRRFVVEDESSETIAEYLTEKGLSDDGMEWDEDTVLAVLTNSVYVGWYRHSDEAGSVSFRVRTPAIVDPEIWEEAQKRIAEFEGESYICRLGVASFRDHVDTSETWNRQISEFAKSDSFAELIWGKLKSFVRTDDIEGKEKLLNALNEDERQMPKHKLSQLHKVVFELRRKHASLIRKQLSNSIHSAFERKLFTELETGLMDQIQRTHAQMDVIRISHRLVEIGLGCRHIWDSAYGNSFIDKLKLADVLVEKIRFIPCGGNDKYDIELVMSYPVITYSIDQDDYEDYGEYIVDVEWEGKYHNVWTTRAFIIKGVSITQQEREAA